MKDLLLPVMVTYTAHQEEERIGLIMDLLIVLLVEERQIHQWIMEITMHMDG